MRKVYSLLLAILLLSTASLRAQIAVTVSGNTNTTPNLAASYTSLATALTDLNSVTAMSGPVTLTLAAGGSETAPPTGLTIGSATLNPVLSATNTVTLVKASGTVTLNAGVGTATPASAAPDGILKLVGADWITVDGLTFTDGNTASAAVSMEYGLGLFKLSASDGAQNNMIRNCTFNMQIVNNTAGTAPMLDGSVGILVINSTPTAATTSLTPGAASGTNSSNKFYTNTINGGNTGIGLSGYAATVGYPLPPLGDVSNDIGGTGALAATTGNTVLNFGGAAAAANAAVGIRANNQWGLNISNNTINNNTGTGVNHVNILRGIYGQAGTSANVSISYNTITLKGGGTTTALTGIENIIGATASSNTVTITNNIIQNCAYTTATTATFSGILAGASATNQNVNNNQVINNTVGASGTASSCTFQGIYASASSTNFTANLNTVSNNTINNSFGTMYCVRASTSTLVYDGNTVSNNGFPTSAGATSSTLYGFYDGSSPVNETYTNNNINNLSIAGASTATGHSIYGIYNTTAVGTKIFTGNNINNFSFTSSGAGYATVVGLRNLYTTTSTINKNVIHTLSSTGTAPLVAGLYLGSTSVTTINAFNNIIGNLNTPASTTHSVVGIYVGSAGTNINLYYNTVYLNATSTGTGFGSSAVYMSSTTPTTTLRNNVLVNLSTATGTGLTTVLRRTSTTLTAYGTTSNNNLFYAGAPSSSNVIYYDGTNSDQTLAAFKTRVSSRESASVTENPPFLSTTGPATGTATTFLHINPALGTLVESAGAPIAGYTDDFDGDTRNGTTPDLGADEGTFTPPPPCAAPTSQPTSLVLTPGLITMSGSFTNASSVPSGYLVIRTLANTAPVPVNGTTYAIGNNVLGYIESASSQTTFSSTGLSPTTTYYYWVYSFNSSNCTGGPIYLTTAPLTGSQITNTPGTIVSTAAGGNWSQTSTWQSGVVPTATDNVTIANGATVTIDVAAVAYTLNVGQGTTGILQFEPATARTLTIGTNVTIASGGIFQAAATGTITTHTLSVNGNLLNNGTLDFSTNSNTAGADIIFTGSADNSFGGTGGTTDVRTITLNKGTVYTPILELNPSNFTVQGVNTDNAGFLTLTNGTLKISGTFTMTNRVFPSATYVIPATGGIWLNNPNFVVAGQAGVTTCANNGLFRITQGVYNIGLTGADEMGAAAGAVFTIEGGTVNVAGRLDPQNAVTYTQTAGTVNIATVGNTRSNFGSFELFGGATSSFTMSGGIINIVNPSTGSTKIDYTNTSGIQNITGGQIVFGASGAPASSTYIVGFASYVPNFTINSSMTLNVNATTIQFNGTTATNNGAITSTGAGRFDFAGAAPMTYGGTGTFGTNAAPFGTTGVGSSSEALTTLNAPIITTRVNLFSGGFVSSNQISIGGGGSAGCLIQRGGGAAGPGSFDVAPTFNLGTGALSLSYFTSTLPVVTGFEVPASRSINALTINTGGPNVTLAGGDLSLNSGATPTLTLTTGNMNLGGSTLVLGTSPTVAGTLSGTGSTLYNGKFKRWIGTTTGNRDFPVGIAAAKRNAAINFTTAATAGGTLTAEWISSNPGTNGLPLTEGTINVTQVASDGYWRISAADGLTGGTYTGTFTVNSISGIVDPAQLVLLKRSETPGSLWTLDGTHVTSTGTTVSAVLSRTGMSGFSEFGIGGSASSLPVTITGIKAYQQGSGVQVEWNVATQINVLSYEVERSVDGRSFTKIGTVQARGNSTSSIAYNWLDAAPVQGNNFYRIRIVNLSSAAQYTSVAKVFIGKGAEAISIYPNPVKGDVVNLQLTNLEKGNYTLRLTNQLGQTIFSEIITHNGGSANMSLNIAGSLTNGIYQLQVVGKTASFTQTLVKQ
jgi:hypothetical protein